MILNFGTGVFPDCALFNGKAYIALREGDPRNAGALVVWTFPVHDASARELLFSSPLGPGSPAFPRLSVVDDVLWLAYHDGAQLHLHNLMGGQVWDFDGHGNDPCCFGGHWFARQATGVPSYDVIRVDLRNREELHVREGAPTGLSRVLADGMVRLIDEDRHSLPGATLPSYAEDLVVGEGPTGGAVWQLGSDRGLLWAGQLCFAPKCAAVASHIAICTHGPDARAFVGTRAELKSFTPEDIMNYDVAPLNAFAQQRWNELPHSTRHEQASALFRILWDFRQQTDDPIEVFRKGTGGTHFLGSDGHGYAEDTCVINEGANGKWYKDVGVAFGIPSASLDFGGEWLRPSAADDAKCFPPPPPKEPEEIMNYDVAPLNAFAQQRWNELPHSTRHEQASALFRILWEFRQRTDDPIEVFRKGTGGTHFLGSDGHGYAEDICVINEGANGKWYQDVGVSFGIPSARLDFGGEWLRPSPGDDVRCFPPPPPKVPPEKDIATKVRALEQASAQQKEQLAIQANGLDKLKADLAALELRVSQLE